MLSQFGNRRSGLSSLKYPGYHHELLWQWAAWWVAHREAINRARAAEAEPIGTDKAVNIEIEDRAL
jgi:hypothetical protein